MSTSNKAKLTCSLTGQTRQSSHKYIAKKAEQYGVSSEVFQQYYVAKTPYLNFKASLENDGVDTVLTALNMDTDTAEYILKYNGKSQKTLSDFQTSPTVKADAEGVDAEEEVIQEPELVGV
jgi:hypothetical protein|tara:strand:- start:1022 stop:1384 length:363 start_codon:yes stop_codon:yes gene_type:complete